MANVIDIRKYFEGRDEYLSAKTFVEKEGDILMRIVSYLPLSEEDRMDIAYKLMCERQQRRRKGL